ncbi:Hypp2915 [Branchiostoma lanceolatum]|uniref:Hypp2915 protein n=1 Tax=Branchiostoma lanceolatum TaxID=7740 RepID=A0A8K0EPV9_BRALA|nr:Hypp2915 [Branchiostoma lanceolatum]
MAEVVEDDSMDVEEQSHHDSPQAQRRRTVIQSTSTQQTLLDHPDVISVEETDDDEEDGRSTSERPIELVRDGDSDNVITVDEGEEEGEHDEDDEDETDVEDDTGADPDAGAREEEAQQLGNLGTTEGVHDTERQADTIITSEEAKFNEHRHLENALNKCGYKRWTFHKALKPADESKKPSNEKHMQKRKTTANATIPYIQGVSEKLRIILQDFNIATSFKPYSTLRQKLVHPKDRVRKHIKSDVIYRLKCEHPQCRDTYIGETSQPLKTRYNQHCRATASKYSSAIYHHMKHHRGHSFRLETTDVLDREPRWYERGIREAIYERIYKPTLNRKGGLRVELSGTWDSTLPPPNGQ